MPIGASKNSWFNEVGGVKRLAQQQSSLSLYVMGGSLQWESGEGLTGFRYTYGKITDSGDYTKVAAGHSWTLALKDDGTLWAWGMHSNDPEATPLTRNAMGLGANDLFAPTPTQVGTADNWSDIWACQYSSFGLRTDGTLWAWGDAYTSSGGLGLGNSDTSCGAQRETVPTQIGTANNWTNIFSTNGPFENTCMAVNTSGELYSWGDGRYGKHGQGDTVDRCRPIQVTGATGWTKVAAGHHHSLALKDGVIYGTGRNHLYQLGLGDTTDRSVLTEITGSSVSFVDIAVLGYHTSMAIRSDGTLWGWGSNGRALFPQISNPSYYAVPTQMGTDSDWESFEESKNTYGMIGVAVKKTNGVIYGILGYSQGAWGISNQSQELYSEFGLGQKNYTATGYSPIGGSTGFSVGLSSVACGRHHGAIVKDGDIWTCGRNDRGQLGNGVVSEGTSLIDEGPWEKILNGLDHASSNYLKNIYLTKSDGTLWGVGQAASINNSDSFGNNLGSGANAGTTNKVLYRSPTQISTETFWNDILSFSAAANLAYFVKSDGTLWYTGNEYTFNGGRVETWTQIGSASDWKNISVSLDGSRYAVKNNGELYVWGENSYGQLGLGDTTDRTSAIVQSGTADNWSYISCGQRYALGMKTDGTIWASGWNFYGRLGLRDTTDRNTWTQISDNDWAAVRCCTQTSLGLKTNGDLYAWGGWVISSTNSSPIKIGTDNDWVFPAGGANFMTHTLKTDGSIWAIINEGIQDYNPLGLGEEWENFGSFPVQIGEAILPPIEPENVGFAQSAVWILA